MEKANIKLFKCRLCGEVFSEIDMSEEHYPAKSVGNDDILSMKENKSTLKGMLQMI